MDDQFIALEREYCPPVDTALFYAIISDFDLSKPDLLKSARATLDEIKATAETEESLAFDPSGSSNVRDSDSFKPDSQGKARSSSGDQLTNSDDTDLTSLTASVGSLHLGSEASESKSPTLHEYDYAIESLSKVDKLAILREGFPLLKPFDVEFTLTRCGDNVEKAIDELLTQSFLGGKVGGDGESYFVPKGIDGFAQNDYDLRKRKGKGKKKKRFDLSNEDQGSGVSTQDHGASAGVNKWSAAKRDVEFITQKTGLPLQAVTSAYHKSSGSLRNTIIFLAEQNVAQSGISIKDEDAIIQINISELRVDFPVVSEDHLRGIVRLSHPSTAAAHDLTKALCKSPFASAPIIAKETPLMPQYARPIIEGDDGGTFTPIRRKQTTRRTPNAEGEAAKILAAKYNSARAAAFSQATAAYRKSRSNPLMGGAAAYYASVGHEAQASAIAYTSAAADALVLRQSTANQIDLHGVDVKNATRIAEERVQAWWDSGRAEWAREGRVMGHGGFSIITGVGKHSQGGKGRLGPAVRKALVQGGWRVDGDQGMLTVVGRARK